MDEASFEFGASTVCMDIVISIFTIIAMMINK